MRNVRHHRMISMHKGKQNEVNKSNLPLLESKGFQKVSLKHDYRLKIKDHKKKYLKLCTKEDKCTKERNLDSLVSARFQTNYSVSPQMSSQYLTSRGEKKDKPKYLKFSTNSYLSNTVNILSRHKITPSMRSKMIDWLMEIIQAYELKHQTFFLAVHLMDSYFKNSSESLAVQQLHIIGVTCIFMACKYQEIHPLRLKTVYRDIGHSKIPMKKIIEREAQILKAINFVFGFKCAYMMCEEYLYDMEDNIHPHEMNKIRQIAIYLLKLAIFDITHFYSKKPQVLSRSCILAAIRMNSQASSSLQLYDNFISTCKMDYQSLHSNCTQLFSLHTTFYMEHPDLQNIAKINPVKSCNRLNAKMIQSCAL